jgi:glycyl-tRNA synthetase beta chain
MVREFTELQGKMGGIYAREEGLPEDVWKAIYYQYLPIGVEADAAPSRGQLGTAALTWAAVSLADKLDTIAGLFSAGEKPTGSRDPYGLRRAAQGVVKILVDLPSLGAPNGARIDLAAMFQDAFALHHATPEDAITDFMAEREAHLFERRGFRGDEIRVLIHAWANPHDALKRLEALAKVRASDQFQALALLFKRVKNITKGVEDTGQELAQLRPVLQEPAELALADELGRRWPTLDEALNAGRYLDAMHELAGFYPVVDRFFIDVLVMADDPQVRTARLALLTRLRSAVLNRIGDISEIASEERPT